MASPSMVMVFHLILLLLRSNIIFSHTIIKTLPGYAGNLPFKLETGYIGVGETEDVQLFYYYVESERDPKNDPLIIWLSGGPGCSTLRAFFFEIGPLTFNYANSSGNKPTLELSPYSWTKVANVLFLDQPVGTGFSYANIRKAFRTSDTLSATQTYDFLRKWLISHPKFVNNPLYICGSSYSGIVIPIIVQKIYAGNEVGNEPPMNIKGYMLGNPVTDKNSDFNSRVQFAHQLAFLSDELYESAKANCRGDYTQLGLQLSLNDARCENDLQEVAKCLSNINFAQILEPLCGSVTTKPNLLKFDGSSLEDNPIRSEPSCRNDIYTFSTMWANDRTVQKALHIREGTITEWERCNMNTFYSFGKNASISYSFNVQSSVEYHRNLTDKSCRALIFSGDHDLVVPHVGTEKWIRSLNLTIKNAWEPWFLGGQVAGFATTFSQNDYSLTYATIKGAGHTAQEYKPKECLAMVDRWFGNNHL